MVVPTVLYGVQTWGEIMDERHKLYVMEIKCLQSMCEVSRFVRWNNQEFRHKVNVGEMMSDIVDVRVLGRF